VARLLPGAADEERAVPDAARLAAHLAECASCRREAERYRALAERIGEEPVARAILPGGEQVTRWILEREASRAPVSLSWRMIAMPMVALGAAVALVLVPRDREPNPASEPPPPTVSTQAALPPQLVVVDDERTGRQVVLGPALSGSRREP
jgi:hypothetical protein